MPTDVDVSKSRDDSKDLLLEEYRAITESLWKNEQIGETRVNWFIGIVTVVAGALVSLASAERTPSGESLGAIVIASLISLLVLGIITLLRMIKRNATTDGFKQDLATIRQTVKDYFDGDHVLLYYQPFGPRVAKIGSDGEPEERRMKNIGRTLGGLAPTVSAINSLLFAALVATIGNCLLPTEVVRGLGGAGLLIIDGALAATAFVLVFRSQNTWLKDEEAKEMNKLHQGSPTHAGGIAYKINCDGSVEYLLVGPMNGAENTWVFPKGHIEDGEGHGEAALREVREEAGVVARLIGFVDRVKFTVPNIADQSPHEVDAKFYLLEWLYDTQRDPKESRLVQWFSAETALSNLKHVESQYLLQEAEWKRAHLSETAPAFPRGARLYSHQGPIPSITRRPQA